MSPTRLFGAKAIDLLTLCIHTIYESQWVVNSVYTFSYTVVPIVLLSKNIKIAFIFSQPKQPSTGGPALLYEKHVANAVS